MRGDDTINMKIAICDDNEQFVIKLEKLIFKYFRGKEPDVPAIYKYYSGEELINSKEVFDIVFIDVEMGKMSGLKTITWIKPRNRYAIFIVISSFDEYLDEAMGIKVFRYMTKPLNEQRFNRNMRDALKALSTASKKVRIETKSGNEYIEEADIIMFEVLDGNVVVHTVLGHFDAKGRIQDYKEKVNPIRFFESSRGYLINLQHVSGDSDTYIKLNDGKCRARLSRRKRKEYKHAFAEYLNNIEVY